VTSEQLDAGWLESCGHHAVRHDFQVLAYREDGTFVVREPDLEKDGSPLTIRPEPTGLTRAELNVMADLVIRLEGDQDA